MPEAGGQTTTATTATAAEIVARRLYDAGCRFAFGIPGGEVLTLMDALAAAGIQFVLTKHENAAGFMAEGTFFADGAPGILLATIGPGVGNAINVVANAEQDRVPLIFLTGCVDAADTMTHTHQIFDHRAVLEPITRATFTLLDGVADVVIDKALAMALDGQPGPVHVDVPIPVAEAVQSGPPMPRRVPPTPSVPTGPDLETARQWLAAAERPLIVAGVDVLNDGASDVVAALAEDFSIPVITTYNAKGVLPEDHALALGGAGLSPKADAHLIPFLGISDFIVLAGYDPIEMRRGWRNPWPEATRVVDISAVPNTHYMHQGSLNFVGHVGACIEALRAGVEPRATWPGDEPSALQASLRADFGGDEDWGPAAVVDAVRTVLPRHGVATVDTGAHRILLNHVWECYAPRGLLQSTGLGTMGCALPLAMGHRLAKPDVPVVAFTGDAGLEMVLGELATLHDLGGPLPIVVFVDRSLALIELKQRDLGYDNLAVDFGGTDFVAVARAFGGDGVNANDREALTAAMTDALDRDTFTIIACEIGERPYDGRF